MELKVLSWNIWVNNKFQLVKQFLKNSNSDVFGLQEVSSNDPLRDTVGYLNSLGYREVFAPLSRPWVATGRTDGPAIFTKHKIVSSKKYALSEKYGVGAVQADIQIGDKTIHFFSTHLSHTHQQDSADQLDQLQQLLSVIPSETSILVGDFNALPTSRTIQEVKAKLVDADHDNQPTWSIYPDGCEICKPPKIDLRLDYIFTTKDITAHSYQVEDSKGSDHLPISTTVEL